jgi:molybdopterin-binding protein
MERRHPQVVMDALPLTPTMKDHVMKLSARNQLKGKIVDVVKGATTSHVRIDIGGGVMVTASITNEAVADLALAQGRRRLGGDQGIRRDDRQMTAQ